MHRRMMMAGLTACLAGTGFLVGSALLATQAEAGERSWNRTGTVTGPGGKTVTREATVTRDGNSWQRDVTVTGPNGGTWTRHGQGSCSGGVCTYGGTVTGPRGNTGTYSGTSGPSP